MSDDDDDDDEIFHIGDCFYIQDGFGSFGKSHLCVIAEIVRIERK